MQTYSHFVVLVDSVVFINKVHASSFIPELFAVGNLLDFQARRPFGGQLDELTVFFGAASMRQAIDLRYADSFGSAIWAPLQDTTTWHHAFRGVSQLVTPAVLNSEAFLTRGAFCSKSSGCRLGGQIDSPTGEFTISVRSCRGAFSLYL